MSFVNVFGGSVLEPSQVAYRAVALSASVTLVWPPLSQSATDFVAAVMDVTPSAGSLAITLPPANQVSQGENILFTNKGSQTYSVLSNTGVVITSVTAGQYVMVYLTDNSTVAGTWVAYLFGSGSSALSAATVAGYGIYAIANTLNSSLPVSVTSTNTTIAASDRASTYVWNGGAGTFTLPSVGTVGNNFFFGLNNQGTGSVTINPHGGEFIDSQSSITLQPTESVILIAGDTAKWYSLGRGRSTQFNFTQLVKNVTGGTDTLTQVEAANVIQKYQGALISNETVVVPAVVQVYYVSNNTSGAFTFTMQSPTPGTVVTIPSGQSAILFCDGTNVINTSTTISGISSLVLSPGTVTNPTISFTGDADTGIYQATTNTLSIAASGSEAARFTTAGINSAAIGATTPSTGAFTTLSASGAVALSPANANVVLSPTGTGVVTINPATAGTMNRVAIGGTTPATGVFTTVNKVTITAPATSSTITIADGKTFTSSNTLTLTGTDGSTLNVGAGGTLGSAAYTGSGAYAPAAGSSSITTVGTIGSGTWNGTSIAVANGGTGAATASTARTALGVAYGPAFSAYATGVTSLVQNVATKVLYAGEEFDTDNAFSSSTFTVPAGKDGYYFFLAAVGFASTVATSTMRFYKNGSEIVRGISANSGLIAGSAFISLVAGDTVEAYCLQDQATQNTATVQSQTRFSGFLVRYA